MYRIQQENEELKKTVKTLLEDVEELVVNDANKSAELYSKTRECEQMTEDLQTNKSALANATAELQKLRDISAHQRKRIAVLRDLAGIGKAVGGSELNFKPNVDTIGKLEEELAVARLHISKMESEINNMVQHCGTIAADIAANENKEEYARFLCEFRLLIFQKESRCASLTESMRKAEKKKRQLEEAADALREECARLQVVERVHAAAAEERIGLQLRGALEAKLNGVRDELAAVQRQEQELKDSHQELKLAGQQMRAEHEKLARQETNNAAKLKELTYGVECYKKALADLKFLEETVAKDL